MEVVLDPTQDQAVVHAAFTSADISPALVEQILSSLEETAARMAETSEWDLSLSPSKGLGSSGTAAATAASSEEAEDLTNVDQEAVSKICAIAAQFLRVDESLVAAETSLMSLGLDSIKSVGLSRRCTAEGLSMTSADIMRLSTPLRLAAYVQRSKANVRREDSVSDAAFAADCEKLKEALDIEAIKLDADDEVQVFPTSVLQAGMLSQVRSHVCP